MRWVRTLLREPLLHFVLLGGVLFLVLGGGEEPPSDRIVISEGQVRNLAAVFERTWRRPPTGAELEGLIQDRIDEEVLAREAIALGLDQDDTVIRRRLRQKMEFVAQNLASPEPASESELQAYLEAHRERFVRPGRLTFTQVFLDRERRGRGLEGDAARILARLKGVGAVDPWALGDPTLLEASYADVTTSDVDRLFGADFAERLTTLPAGRWAGPVRSPYGAHLVRVDAHTPAALPTLDQVRAAVAREVEAERVAEARDAFVTDLRERYEVVVERAGPDLAMAGDEEARQ